MKANEAIEQLNDPEWLEKLYAFAYHRCSSSHDAEDLCSDILVALLAAIRRQEDILHFHGFVWTVARRVYADFCAERSRSTRHLSLENSVLPPADEGEIDRFLDEEHDRQQLRRILEEITFLSRAYREVMVLYYLDGRTVREIAAILGIAETTVKQRLFSARNTVKKGVETMTTRNLSLKPIQLAFIGTGNPGWGDPRNNARRTLSKNLIYLCKDKPKTAKELSEELCVPMPYIEEELACLCHGMNGEYGLLRQLENGKYAINILLADYSEFDAANQIFERHVPALYAVLKDNIDTCREDILGFPYLYEQTDIRLPLWLLIHRAYWAFSDTVQEILRKKFFPHIQQTERPFFCAAVAYNENDCLEKVYGCDGVDAYELCGYKRIFMFNLYGRRLERHFDCGHNLAHDKELRLLLHSIRGLSMTELSDAEKEHAAKAIRAGYLRRDGDRLEPQVVAVNWADQEAFFALARRLTENCQPILETIAEELAAFMKKHIPAHLMGEYHIYTHLIASVRALTAITEECIRNGLLNAPENRLGPEGVFLAVDQ